MVSSFKTVLLICVVLFLGLCLRKFSQNFRLGISQGSASVDAFSSPTVVSWSPDTSMTMSRVALGSDGSIFAIDGQGKLFWKTRTSQTGSWQNSTVALNLKEISVRNAQQIIGLTKTSMLFQVSDGNSITRLNNSRFDNVSIGADGSIWATLLPIGGAWGVFSFDSNTKSWNRMPGSIRQLSVRNASDVWGVAPDDSIWHWKAGAWKRIDGSLTQISVGSDGDVWGVNRSHELWHLGIDGDWQKAPGNFLFVDVQNSNLIAAIDSDYHLQLGKSADLTSVTHPIETPFDIKAISGGSSNCPDGCASLIIDGVSVLGSSGIDPPSNGLNLITISDMGHPLQILKFDTQRFPSSGQVFAKSLRNITDNPTAQIALLSSNLYKSMENTNDGVSVDENGVMSISKPGMSTFLQANVLAAKYDIGFSFIGNGTIDLAFSGSAIPSQISPTSLNATASWQQFKISVSFSSPGLHQLNCKLPSGVSVAIKAPSLSANTDDVFPPSMLFVLAHGDVGSSSISVDAVNSVKSIGGRSLGLLKSGGSYLLVYDCKAGQLLDEQVDAQKQVKFTSAGKYPVFESTFTSTSTGSSGPNTLSMMNRTTLIEYDVDNSKLLNTKNLSSTALGSVPPFNQGVDTVISVDADLIVTTDRFWLRIKSDWSSIIAGPNVIGSGFLQIPGLSDPFASGIDSNVVFLNNSRYFFKDRYFLKTDLNMTQILNQNSLGSDEFSGIPKSFHKIHAAFSLKSGANNLLGLLYGDKLVFYDPSSRTIVEGPFSILTDRRFKSLPTSFKVGKIVPAVPFLNQSVFSGQRLKNIDISVTQTDSTPGWSAESFSGLNNNAVANYVPPPIKVKYFTDHYPDIVSKYGNQTNALLTIFEKLSSLNDWIVPTYGGNTISFTLADPKLWSSFTSHSAGNGISNPKVGGIPFHNANLIKGEWYTFSIWVRTEDTGLSVGAYTGLAAPEDVRLAPIKISADQGWQLLSWNFHHPTTSNAADVSITLFQDSSDQSLHSLYGPTLRSIIPLADPNYLKELIALEYFYLSSALDGQLFGMNSQSVYLTKAGTPQSVTAAHAFNERLCAYRGKYPGTVIIGSYAVMKAGHRPLTLCSASGQLTVCDASSDPSEVSADSSMWLLLHSDDDGGILLVNFVTDMLLGCYSGGIVPGLIASEQIDLKPARWNIQTALQRSSVENFQVAPRSIYIDAAIARDPANSSNAFFFHKNVVTEFDLSNMVVVSPPVKFADHNSFAKLPFATIDTGFQKSGSELFIFNGDRFVLWDLDIGSFASSAPQSTQLLGPGGHPFFNNLPAPFNKRLDSSIKLDSKTVLLISRGFWIRWDLTRNVSLDDPQPQNVGLPANLPEDFKANLDSAVEYPSHPGQAFVFSEAQWLLFDFANSKILDGPDLLGPKGRNFTSLIKPFVPSKTEVCQSYKSIIVANSDYPENKCVPDPTSDFPWRLHPDCMFDISTCASANGIWNDSGKFCGTTISKGQTPVKIINPDIRKQYLKKHYQECSSVSEWDYLNMQKKERAKQDNETSVLSDVIAQKQALLKQLDTQQQNLNKINLQLENSRVELSADSEKACHPLVVCLKAIDSNSGMKIPLACNQQKILSVLQKPEITKSDIDIIFDVLRKNNVISDYPIELHPDFPKYINTDSVRPCPSQKHTTVNDFPLTSFPDYSNYIRPTDLLPVNLSSGTYISPDSSSASTSPYLPKITSSVNTSPNVTQTSSLGTSPNLTQTSSVGNSANVTQSQQTSDAPSRSATDTSPSGGRPTPALRISDTATADPISNSSASVRPSPRSVLQSSLQSSSNSVLTSRKYGSTDVSTTNHGSQHVQRPRSSFSKLSSSPSQCSTSYGSRIPDNPFISVNVSNQIDETSPYMIEYRKYIDDLLNTTQCSSA